MSPLGRKLKIIDYILLHRKEAYTRLLRHFNLVHQSNLQKSGEKRYQLESFFILGKAIKEIQRYHIKKILIKILSQHEDKALKFVSISQKLLKS